jgi:ClpP class serine protease
MPDPVNPATPSPPNPIAKIPQAAFLNVITELDVNRDQLTKRQEIIRQIEKLLSIRYGASNRMISYMFRFGHPRAAINSSDIAILETVLNSITGAQQINVLLHSPGGDGTIIEKMVDMCRNHLAGDNRKLRVIVPNIAKSAATLFALGSDEILMGYCSELGPIDPQVQIAVSGVIQSISALAFVESRDNL